MSELRKFKAEIFKALAHASRIHLLDSLRDGEHTVNELCELLNLEGPNVSQQLAILRNKNIVSTRKKGNSVFYSVKDKTIFKLLDVSKKIFSNHLINLQSNFNDE